jgi:hypothetical protein
MIKFWRLLTLKKEKKVLAPKQKVFVGKLNKAYYCDAVIFQDRLSKIIKKGKKAKLKDLFFEEQDSFICLFGYKK